MTDSNTCEHGHTRIHYADPGPHTFLCLDCGEYLTIEEMREKVELYFSKPRLGYVYIAHARSTCFYKIGWSKQPAKRINDPHLTRIEEVKRKDLYLAHVIKTNNVYRLERLLHGIYCNNKIKYEWFMLSDTDIKRLQKIKTVNFSGTWDWDDLVYTRLRTLTADRDQRRVLFPIMSNDAGNIRIVHARCNQIKGGEMPWELGRLL